MSWKIADQSLTRNCAYLEMEITPVENGYVLNVTTKATCKIQHGLTAYSTSWEYLKRLAEKHEQQTYYEEV